MKFATLFSAFAFSGLTACANLSPLTSSVPLNEGTTWLTYDSSRRGAYVVSRGGTTVVCSEPAPDTAYDFHNKLEAAVKSEGVDANAKAELAAKAVALAGRDRVVLTAREGLYRLCEARANGFIGQSDYIGGFQEVMLTVRAMFEAEKAEAVKDIAKTSSEAANTLSKSFAIPESRIMKSQDK